MRSDVVDGFFLRCTLLEGANISLFELLLVLLMLPASSGFHPLIPSCLQYIIDNINNGLYR
jgi:hypothetical protein